MYYLGKTSLRRLETCHPVWKQILLSAIKTTPIDFGVVCGGRGKRVQERVFVEGFSNARWGQSDHNWMQGGRLCSLATDLAPYSAEHRNFMWPEVVGQKVSDKAFELMSNHIITTALDMGYIVETGANYNINGGDKPHHVLKFRRKK